MVKNQYVAIHNMLILYIVNYFYDIEYLHNIFKKFTFFDGCPKSNKILLLQLKKF